MNIFNLTKLIFSVFVFCCPPVLCLTQAAGLLAFSRGLKPVLPELWGPTRGAWICIWGKKKCGTEGGGYILGPHVCVCALVQRGVGGGCGYSLSHVSVNGGVLRQLLSGECPDISLLFSVLFSLHFLFLSLLLHCAHVSLWRECWNWDFIPCC